jgi:hypothetical protein
VRDIYKKNIQPKSTEEFIYKDAKDIFEALTANTEEGRQKNFLGRYKS